MECNKKDRKLMKCANYNMLGHPAWDHMFPLFILCTITYNAKHPKNTYKYYPTAAPETWELLDKGSQYKTPAATPPIPTRLAEGMFEHNDPPGSTQDLTNSWLLTDSDGPRNQKCKWVQSTNIGAQLWLDPFLVQLNLPALENSTPINSKVTMQPTQ